MSVDTKTRLAVALHYDKTGAPRVVAKGKGVIGAKIIELARAHDIPIEENEVLAGALSHVEIGDEIPAELYKAGVSDAVPETLEASLQLSEAALVDLGVAMGPVIASIHEKRDELRAQIKAEAELDEAPRLGGRRLRDLAQPVGSNRSTPAT